MTINWMLLFWATTSSTIDWLTIIFFASWSNMWWRFLQPSTIKIIFDWHNLIPCPFAKQCHYTLYVSTTFFLSAKNFDWSFGQDGDLCTSKYNQHLNVLFFELSDCKWLFLVNSWLVHCLNLLTLLTGYNICYWVEVMMHCYL